MLKRQLVSEITKKTGEPGRVVNAVLDAINDTVLECVGRGEEVFIMQLGKFMVVRRKRRAKIKLKSLADPITLPAHNAVKFQAFSRLRDAARKSKLS